MADFACGSDANGKAISFAPPESVDTLRHLLLQALEYTATLPLATTRATVEANDAKAVIEERNEWKRRYEMARQEIDVYQEKLAALKTRVEESDNQRFMMQCELDSVKSAYDVLREKEAKLRAEQAADLIARTAVTLEWRRMQGQLKKLTVDYEAIVKEEADARTKYGKITKEAANLWMELEREKVERKKANNDSAWFYRY